MNQILFVYNDVGQLTADYQSRSGAVNMATTPAVQYGYADGTDNTVRPTALVYSNGRTLTYDYGTSGGMADAVSRIASIVVRGLSTFVEVDYTEPETGNVRRHRQRHRSGQNRCFLIHCSPITEDKV